MKIIKLTQGRVTLVDDEDFEYLSQVSWYWKRAARSENGYAQRTQRIKGSSKQLHMDMHRIILVARKGQIVDHINGNSLDNRRSNLRFCNLKQNAQNSKLPNTNTSGYKGVSWHKGASKWRVTIKPNQKQVHLGFFENLTEAAKAYNKAAKKYFGEFGYLNNI